MMMMMPLLPFPSPAARRLATPAAWWVGGLLAAAFAVASPAQAQRQRQAPAASRVAEAPSSAAAPAGTAASSPVIDLLRRIEARHGAAQAISGTFTQTVENEFGETVKSNATFWLLKPDRFRAEFQDRGKAVHLIKGNTSYRYTPELNQVERYKFKNSGAARDVNFLLLGFGANTDELLRAYQITDAGKAGKNARSLRLVPYNQADANFNSIIITVTDDAAVLPLQFAMTNKDGSKTTVSLDPRRLSTQAALTPAMFEPNFPRTAEVID